MKNHLLICLARPFTKFVLWSLFFLILPSFMIFGQLLPVGRSIQWTNNTGIPGGVPNRTNIFCNVLVDIPGTNIVAIGNDLTDDSKAIQAALNLCPSNEVVYLPSSVYLLTNLIIIPSGVTLRGNGMGNTILDLHHSEIVFGTSPSPKGPSADPNGNYSTAIISTSNSGTNSFMVSNTSHFYGVGSYMMVTITNDTSYNSNSLVDIVGSEGKATWVDGGLGYNGTRALGQIVQVTNITGTTIGFQPSLYMTYSNSLNPLATSFYMGCSWSGVENLTVKANNTSEGSNFKMQSCAYCWIKNVEGDYTDGDQVDLYFCYRCEVRDNYFHDAYLHTPGTYDSDVCVADKSSACLIEDNILWRLHCSVMLEWGAAGNVIAYNFSTNDFDSSGYNATMMDFSANHGAHPMFNLFEGNVGASFHPDSIWGSSSDGTVFRNYFYGMDYVLPPLIGNSLVQFANGWIAYQCMRCVDIDFASKNYNIIGNVLGDDWMRTNSLVPGVYSVVAPTVRYYDTASYIYSIGYGETSDTGLWTNDNALPYSTAIIEGNYDYVTQSTVWTNAGSYYASGITPVTLPDSLYLTNKPSWWTNWGVTPYPPIGSDLTTKVSDIPAEMRFNSIISSSHPHPIIAPPQNIRIVSP